MYFLRLEMSILAVLQVLALVIPITISCNRRSGNQTYGAKWETTLIGNTTRRVCTCIDSESRERRVGLACVNMEKVFEKFETKECGKLCRRWKRQKISSGGSCYDSYATYFSLCMDNEKCNRTQKFRTYDEKTCRGTWKPVSSRCSKNCATNPENILMQCHEGDKVSYNCIGSGMNTQINMSCQNQPCWGNWTKLRSAYLCSDDGMCEEIRSCLLQGKLSLMCNANQTNEFETRCEKCEKGKGYFSEELSTEEKTDNSLTYAASGGAGGGFFLLVIVVAAAVCLVRSKRKQEDRQFPKETTELSDLASKKASHKTKRENSYCEINFKGKSENAALDGHDWRKSSSFERIPVHYAVPNNIPLHGGRMFNQTHNDGYYSTPQKHKLNDRVWNKTWYDAPRKRTLTGDVFIDSADTLPYSTPRRDARREKVKSNSEFYSFASIENCCEESGDVENRRYGRVLSANSELMSEDAETPNI